MSGPSMIHLVGAARRRQPVGYSPLVPPLSLVLVVALEVDVDVDVEGIALAMQVQCVCFATAC